MKRLIFSLLLFLLLFNKVQALDILPKSNFAIDMSLIDQIENYNLPDSIIVAPLKLPDDVLMQEIELYSGLFYYQSVRLNQNDFLAHYFLTSDGQVLEGNSLGVEQRIKLHESTAKPVIIVYLCKSDATDLTPSAKSSLGKLILSIANAQAITLDKISFKEMSMYVKTNEPVLIKFAELPGSWQASLKEITLEIAKDYKPVPKQYSLAVEKVVIPPGNIVFPATVEVALTIKNKSEHVLYAETDYEPLISKLDNSPSKFYLNGSWLSQTQAPFMSTGSSIKPGESRTFNLQLQAPLHFGLISEEYQLINSLGQAYTGSTFSLALNVNRPEAAVVEITKTETGQLNVRDGPWASSNIIGRVTPGQRFLVLERTDSGFVKLDMGSGKVGWVVSKYTKTI